MKDKKVLLTPEEVLEIISTSTDTVGVKVLALYVDQQIEKATATPTIKQPTEGYGGPTREDILNVIVRAAGDCHYANNYKDYDKSFSYNGMGEPPFLDLLNMLGTHFDVPLAVCSPYTLTYLKLTDIIYEELRKQA